MSIFADLELAPRDPILGLTELFNADPREQKVNLGVGVYYDGAGNLPLLDCVREAESRMSRAPAVRGYLPISGMADYTQCVQDLLFGAGPDKAHIATVQSVGGTGGLKIGADFLKRVNPRASVLISDPSWDNHRTLFVQAGFSRVDFYPYYDATNRSVDFDGMLGALDRASDGTIVVLHACCHNPTAYDLLPTQWAEVIAVMKRRRLVPFLDMAYQGFGDGLDQDAEPARKFGESGLTVFISNSFSKSFSLYGERVGALSVVCASAHEAVKVLSQLKTVIRSNYSTPPTHGAKVVTQILSSPDLRALWESELTGMRDRIKKMRVGLVDALKAIGFARDMSFILRQRGMFSYCGLTPDEMKRLRSEFGVYGTDSGRICISALNGRNVAYVSKAIAAVAS